MNEEPGDDSLFPSDFIICLDNSKKYFGPVKLFGNSESMSEDDAECLLEFVHPSDNYRDEELLRESYAYYLMTIACKRHRGINKDSSMLIHTSFKVADHFLKRNEMERIKSSFDEKLLSDNPDTISYLEKLWKRESKLVDWDKLSRLFGIESSYSSFSTKELINEAKKVCKDIRIVVDNSHVEKKDRLQYDPNNKGCFIVIGGNTLSRGLTINGLTVTVFERNASAYDQLLQMGRWYGYRNGYEDLVRLWMPTELIKRNKLVTGADVDFRAELKELGEFDLSPAECHPRVRYIPEMNIANPTKIKAGSLCNENLLGKVVQTTLLPEQDLEEIQAMTSLVKEFVRSLPSDRLKEVGSNHVFYDIDSKTIESFASQFIVHSGSGRTRNGIIADFIHRLSQKEITQKWNVVLFSNKVKDNDSFETPYVLKNGTKPRIKAINRSKRSSDGLLANIGTLCSFEDLLSDIPNAPKLPDSKRDTALQIRKDHGFGDTALLIIYYINPQYEPTKTGENSKTERYALNAKAPLFGVSYTFPDSSKKIATNMIKIQ